MSMMLTLIHSGWDSIRNAAARGQRHDALTKLTRFLALPDLPASLAAEAHRLAGELALESEQFSKARHHLRAAAALEPSHANTHYQLGLALERDPHGCDRRAALRFRLAFRQEKTNCLYRAAFGRAAVRCGRTRIGVRALRSAARQTSDVAVLRLVVEGLLEAGRVREAQRVLTRARFTQPASRELNVLFEKTRFAAALKAQRELGGTTRHRQDAEHAMDGGRVVLPFVRLAATTATRTETEGVVRRDVLSFPRPHLPRLRVQGRR